MTPLEWSLLFVVIWFLFLRNIRFRIVKQEHQEQGGEKLEEEVLNNMKPPIVCHTELIGEQIYIWNKETNAFIMQGHSIEDIVKFFTEKYPGRKIILVEKEQE